MKFTIQSGSSHSRVEMSGEPTSEEVRAMFEEMARRHAAGGPPRALIELRVAHCLNLLETMNVVSALPEAGFPPGYKIALLITDAKMRDSAGFAETAAVNRGIPLRAFDEREAALRWLDG